MELLSTMVVLAALGGVEQRVLVEFASDECPACRTMESTNLRLLKEGFPLRQIDVRQSPALAQKYAIRGLPTYVMLVNNREVGRVVGAVSHDRLVQLVRTNPVERGTTIRAQSPTPLSRQASNPNVNRLAVATAGREGPFVEPWLNQGPNRTQARPPKSPKVTLPSSQARGSNSLHTRALAATVRLKIEDPRGNSYGTGTVVDARNGEALVLTCGHIFRDSQGRGTISIDLFQNHRRQTIPGRLIAYDLQKDVALVSMKPGVAIKSMMVAPPTRRILQGDQVFSVGCDRGGEPQLRESSITAVNKYVGPANVEVAGAPVDGRSGGGLFTADGFLIGVCNCADPADNEGIYAANEVVADFLDSHRLGFVHRRPNVSTQTIANSRQHPVRQLAMTDQVGDLSHDTNSSVVVLRPNEHQVLDQLRQRLETGEVTFVVRSLAEPIRKDNVYVLGPAPQTTTRPNRQAVLKAIECAPNDTELICISRSNAGAQANSDIVSLSRPSARFVAELKRLLRL